MYGQPPYNGWRGAEPPYNGGGSSWRGAEPPYNGGGRGWNRAPPPPSPLGYQSPHVNHHPQSPNLFHPSNNPNFPVQNPNFRGFPVQPSRRFQFERPPPPSPPPLPQAKSYSNSGEIVLKVDKAVKKAWRDLVKAGENVSAWKVSQAALAIVKADSWESLGVQMQHVPSLHSLILIEGKIVAFIHCFVAVLRVITLYDLEVAICKNEGIEQFEKLELGPLLKHPLIVHYFSVNPDVSEVFKITNEEITSFLSEFMDGNGSTDMKIDEVLNFIAEKKSAGSREKLGVRIQSLCSFDMGERGQPSVGMGYPQQALLTGRFSSHVHNGLVPSTVNPAINNVTAPQDLNYNSFDARERVQLSFGMVDPQQALLTGRFSDHVHNVLVPSTVNPAINNVTAPQDLNYNSFDARERVQLSFGMVDPQQALFTGRLGESAAFNYFVGKFGKPFVKWVNETNETGLPYDLLVAGNEYIEVKATRSVTKDWFHITLREWQFALEKGELFSIAHVVLSPHNAATVTVYKNPARLCCLGKLQLALIIPK